MVRRLQLATLIFICALLVTLVPPRADEILKSIRIGTFSVVTDYAPYLIARKRGWIDENLSKVGYIAQYLDPFQSLAPINEALATGAADFIFAAETPLLIGRSSGIDDKIAWYSCASKIELLVPTESSAKSLSDLKGKRVAGLSGTSAHFGFLDNIQKDGLASDAVSFVPMSPPEAKAAFETKSVDGWAIWTPFVEQEILSGKARPLAGFSSSAQVVMVGRTIFMNQNPKALKALKAALDRARSWIKAHPREAQQAMSDELHLPLEVIALAWPRLDWSSSWDEVVTADIQKKADFLFDQGLVKQRVRVKQDFVMDSNFKEPTHD